ncbi:MAG: hypothetical protein ACR2M7_00555 [Bdellovibrionales bacterium]
MSIYYVNKNAQSSGEHEVHTSGCPHPPDQSNRDFLGNYSLCFLAVQEARKKYPNVDGCAYCCPDCHTK